MIYLRILTLILLLPMISSGQATPEDEKIAAALRSGNTSALSVYLSTTLELQVPGQEGSFSSSQAQLILKEFFQKNKPTGFIIKHQGASKQDSHYCIGTLQTSKGNFRVYYLLRKISGKLLIQMLEISEE